MPIYEYRCGACGFEQEIMQKMSEPALTDCPQCGRSTFAKLISAAGFQLKGTGWYATDFRAGAKGSAGKEEAKEPQPKEEAKTDATCGAGACPACR
ncbi:MAG TPA: FmdB family zinc ribbon protein [Burkholderiales bacterium]|nr:FmdB family zinc ribbon protein [Burkholderiales bacterium]